MELERAAIMGRLAEAKEKESRLSMLVESHCQAIRAGLNTVLTPPADLEIPAIGVQWDALEATWAELQTTRLEIARLQRGLH